MESFETAKIGTRVQTRLLTEKQLLQGQIVGHSVIYGSQFVYLVELDCGFWAEDRKVFVSVLVCDPSSIEEIEA